VLLRSLCFSSHAECCRRASGERYGIDATSAEPSSHVVSVFTSALACAVGLAIGRTEAPLHPRTRGADPYAPDQEIGPRGLPDDVDRREEADPDDVDEVPVDRRTLEQQMAS